MGSVLHSPGRSVLVLVKPCVKKPVTTTEVKLLIIWTLALVSLILILAL